MCGRRRRPFWIVQSGFPLSLNIVGGGQKSSFFLSWHPFLLLFHSFMDCLHFLFHRLIWLHVLPLAPCPYLTTTTSPNTNTYHTSQHHNTIYHLSDKLAFPLSIIVIPVLNVILDWRWSPLTVPFNVFNYVPGAVNDRSKYISVFWHHRRRPLAYIIILYTGSFRFLLFQLQAQELSSSSLSSVTIAHLLTRHRSRPKPFVIYYQWFFERRA